jgi:hypothetical protein
MADSKERRRTIGQDDIAHEGFKVEVVVGEIAHITFAAIRQRAVGKSLPAPIQRRDREPTCAQIAHGFEIFFDPFRAALENAYRAAAPSRRQPPGEAKSNAVRGLERAGDKVVGNRVRGNRDKFHEGVFGRAAVFAYNSR